MESIEEIAKAGMNYLEKTDRLDTNYVPHFFRGIGNGNYLCSLIKKVTSTTLLMGSIQPNGLIVMHKNINPQMN